MKKILSLILCMSVLMLIPFDGAAQKKSPKDTEQFRYEIEGVSNGAQGSYSVRVWTYSGTKNVNFEVCKKNAVHAIIFKGYAGSGQVRPQQPLVKEPGAEVTHADYFKMFFADGGEYNKYVTITAGSQEIVKVGKQYKIGLIVSVSKDMLRKALENAGIVRSLSSGF